METAFAGDAFRGTDHGTGGLALIAGGLIANGRGGQVITNKWPGLADDRLYENRDLMPTDDVRQLRSTGRLNDDAPGMTAVASNLSHCSSSEQ